MRFVGALRSEVIRTVIPKKTTVTAHPDDVDRCHCGKQDMIDCMMDGIPNLFEGFSKFE